MSRKPSTTPDPQPSSRTGELVMVDPGQLVTRRNVRVDLHLDEAFTEVRVGPFSADIVSR